MGINIMRSSRLAWITGRETFLYRVTSMSGGGGGLA